MEFFNLFFYERIEQKQILVLKEQPQGLHISGPINCERYVHRCIFMTTPDNTKSQHTFKIHCSIVNFVCSDSIWALVAVALFFGKNQKFEIPRL